MEISEMLKAVKALPAEVKTLLDQNGQLVDEVERLNSELGHTQLNLDETSDKVKELEDELAHERVTAKSIQRSLQSKIDNLEKEKQQLAEELEALQQKVNDNSDSEPLVKESKKAKETIAKLQDEVESMRSKYESALQELEELKESVEKDYVPVSLLEEGVKDYSEETDPEQGHYIFIILNVLLAGNTPWGRCARRLKAHFKKAMKEFNEMKRLQQNFNAQQQQIQIGENNNQYPNK